MAAREARPTTRHQARSAQRLRVLQLRAELGQAEDALLGLGPGDRLPGLYVMVRARGWRFVVSTSQITDLLHEVDLEPDPARRAGTAGTFRERGQRLVALDLGAVAGLRAMERPRVPAVVVFSGRDRAFGVAVDEVELTCHAPLLVAGDPGSPDRSWRHTRVLASCGEDAVPILDVSALEALASVREAATTAATGEAGIAARVAELERSLERNGLALGRTLRARLEGHLRTAALEGRPEPLLPPVIGGETSVISAFLEAAIVSDTCFFRDAGQLDALARLLLRAADASQRLTLWSAGCGSGEEPYSLAMLLVAERPAGQDVVLATDVCERSIAHARAAEYGPWSIPFEHPLLSRFAERVGSRRVPSAPVRARVVFRRHDVRTPPPESDFDAVVCRNVLSLLEPYEAAAVVRALARAVRPGGYVLLGAGEGGLAAGAPLERIELGRAVLFRRPPAGRRLRRL